MEDYRIESIERITFNGNNVKLVTVYHFENNAWMFVDKYCVSAKIANKNILRYLRDNREL